LKNRAKLSLSAVVAIPIGLASLQIGDGSVLNGNLQSINCAQGSYFISLENDPNGGNDYTITSTQQLLNVPHALYEDIFFATAKYFHLRVLYLHMLRIKTPFKKTALQLKMQGTILRKSSRVGHKTQRLCSHTNAVKTVINEKACANSQCIARQVHMVINGKRYPAMEYRGMNRWLESSGKQHTANSFLLC
jgi:hypothetical protein